MRILIAIFSVFLLLAGGAVAARRPAAKPTGKKVTAVKKRNTSSKAKRPSRRRAVYQRGPAAPGTERIRQIQEALARSGHFRGTATGTLDGPTAVALGNFQQANGLDRTGKLGALTLKKLEQHGLPPNSPMTASEQTGGHAQ